MSLDYVNKKNNRIQVGQVDGASPLAIEHDAICNQLELFGHSKHHIRIGNVEEFMR